MSLLRRLSIAPPQLIGLLVTSDGRGHGRAGDRPVSFGKTTLSSNRVRRYTQL